MRRNNKGGRLLAALLVLIMLLCSFPMVYAADTAAVNTVADREYNPETGMETSAVSAVMIHGVCQNFTGLQLRSVYFFHDL